MPNKNTFPKNVFPVRDMKLAAIFAIAAVLWLVATGYPADDLAPAVVALYLVFYLVMEVAVRLLLFLLKRLATYAEEVAKKLGVGHQEGPVLAEHSRLARSLAMVMFVLLLGAILGTTLVVSSPVIAAIGITALPTYSTWLGWILLGAGTGIHLAMLGSSALVVFAVDSLSETVSPKFDQFQAVAREVDDRLRGAAAAW